MNHRITDEQWARMLLLLADTQQWINDICMQTISSIHPPAKKILKGKQYRLSVTGLAHIIERHWYKVLRHPGTGKFQLDIPGMLDLLRQAAAAPEQAMPGCLNQVRVLEHTEPVGIDRNGQPCRCITVITDQYGVIITAFPGLLQDKE